MKTIIAFLFPALFLLSCSDKYKSLADSAPKPDLSFNKDTIRIREKDYSNILFTNNGKLTLYFGQAGHQLNVSLSDTSNKVHFNYRGAIVPNGQPLLVMDSLNLFCTCDTAGIYPVDFFLTDQLGKTTNKTLYVKCSANQAATEAFFYRLVDNSIDQSWLYHFDASLSTKPDGIITMYHWSIDGQAIPSTSPFFDYTYHAVGIHIVGLYVTDDLNKNSDTVYQQFEIK